jgi:hypothetical protein
MKKIMSLMERLHHLLRSQTTGCAVLTLFALPSKAARCCKVLWSKAVLHPKSKIPIFIFYEIYIVFFFFCKIWHHLHWYSEQLRDNELHTDIALNDLTRHVLEDRQGKCYPLGKLGGNV